MENEHASADRSLHLRLMPEAIKSRLQAMLPGLVLDQQAIWAAQLSAIWLDIRQRLKALNDFYNKCDVEEAKKRLHYERITENA
jgi:hypothetical protein